MLNKYWSDVYAKQWLPLPLQTNFSPTTPSLLAKNRRVDCFKTLHFQSSFTFSVPDEPNKLTPSKFSWAQLTPSFKSAQLTPNFSLTQLTANFSTA